MGQKEAATTNKSRIMIYGPKTDGTYVIDPKIRGAVPPLSRLSTDMRVLYCFHQNDA
jgi:hypothetical protein